MRLARGGGDGNDAEQQDRCKRIQVENLEHFPGRRARGSKKHIGHPTARSVRRPALLACVCLYSAISQSVGHNLEAPLGFSKGSLPLILRRYYYPRWACYGVAGCIGGGSAKRFTSSAS